MILPLLKGANYGSCKLRFPLAFARLGNSQTQLQVGGCQPEGGLCSDRNALYRSDVDCGTQAGIEG